MSVVIPTRFDRPSLWPLIDAAQAVGPVVLVHTERGHDDIPGVENVRDYRRNIGHWWNSGLEARPHMPTLILNDDIEASHTALAVMLVALRDADLVYVPGRGRRAATPISGWCFGLRPDVLRPDPSFTWWCSDDDLYRRAIADGLRVRRVDGVDIRHIDRGGFHAPDEFRAAVQSDRELYRLTWGVA